ncbi:hypothetical protein EUGRSUZ_B00517 [Eucalyptus grandis]|uniref:Uncharacterized protein n=2 Tax=Eucalyptus grandis TaxID=71139 RepID=A0ACC3LPF1_EUCGR|nr:hypothetical protein EUGRSUZ_B00517 [Eucalyptus grandis]
MFRCPSSCILTRYFEKEKEKNIIGLGPFKPIWSGFFTGFSRSSVQSVPFQVFIFFPSVILGSNNYS